MMERVVPVTGNIAEARNPGIHTIAPLRVSIHCRRLAVTDMPASLNMSLSLRDPFMPNGVMRSP